MSKPRELSRVAAPFRLLVMAAVLLAVSVIGRTVRAADGGTDAGADTGADVGVTALSIMPMSATVGTGAMMTFTASGGTPPYTWSITTNGSGGAKVKAGVYTAGAMAGTDVVTVTDSTGATATATVTVTVVTVGIGAMCLNADGGVIPGVCPAGAFCVDGVCCMTACTGACQACNTSTMLGTCATISGAPIHTGCSGSLTDVCSAMICDGTNPTACSGFVGKETTCGIPSCIDGIGTPGAACDGDGGCVKVAPVSCGIFACVSDMCATSCTDTSECSPGNYCDVKSGKCIKPPPVPDSGTGSTTPTTPVTTPSGCSIGRRGRDPSPPLLMLMGLLATRGLRRRRRA